MCRFLPAPSVRRATFAVFEKLRNLTISIHALREEGDPAVSAVFCKMQNFYPRPPRGGRPSVVPTVTSCTNFYPRPPRGGRHGGRDSQRPGYNFYPRPPRGGRRLHHAALEPALLFLSTPSARRATDGLRSNLQTQLISIHALREEGDRAAQLARASAAEAISIHALREEGDRWSV